MALATHTCSCGRVCRGPVKPKLTAGAPAVDATRRYKGACPACKGKVGHREVCAMRDAIRARLLATTPDELRAGVSPRFRAAMAVPQYSKTLTVGCVTFGNEADAEACRAGMDAYKALQEQRRAEHEAWTERWQAEAWEAYYASPEGLAELEAEAQRPPKHPPEHLQPVERRLVEQWRELAAA